MALDRWNRMMNGSDGMMNGGFWLMSIVGLLLIVLLGVGIYVVLKAVKPQPPASERMVSAASTPREVLDLRLARGEISPEEYSTARPLLDA